MTAAAMNPAGPSLSASITSTCHAYRSEDPCVPCALAACGEASGLLPVAHRRVRRGQPLYREGDAFRSIYAVRSGTLKSVFSALHDREQVTGFQMAGEMLGLDGVGHGRHATSAIALEDSEVLAIPFAAFVRGGTGELHEILPRLLGRELVRRQKLAALLAAMGAEQRLASFVLNLSRRLQARGYSATEFHLRMTRGEIGSYLGMNVETVSRTFSALQQRGILQVSGRHVRLLDRPALVRFFDTARDRSHAALPGVLHA